MEERSNYLLVGVFVLTALVASIGFVLWVAEVRTTKEPEEYVIVFDRDVSGLTVGSPVRYLGVDVGQVADMALITDEGTRVAVRIAVSTEAPVDQGTYASLAYQGITGVAFITLAADGGDYPALSVDPSFGHPVIPARDVGLAALLAESGNITTQVTTVLDRVNELLDGENRDSLGRTLANLEALTGSLAGQRDSIGQLPVELLAAVTRLRATLDQLSTLIDESQPDLRSAVAQVRDASASIASITDRFDRMLSHNNQPLDEFVGEGLGELPGLVADARSALRELDKLLVGLRENPSQLVHRPRQKAMTVER